MLDRAHALLHREFDVLDANVVLEVDESLETAVAEDVQRRAEHAARTGRRIDNGIEARRRRGEAGRRRGRAPGRVALGEGLHEAERGVASAGRALALR